MGTLRQDIVFGLRMLAKKPMPTAIAVLSLAPGIGLNAAILTFIHTILWGALPYREPDRIAVIRSNSPGHPDQFNGAADHDRAAGMRGADAPGRECRSNACATISRTL
jgi:putative ABC transport system permease protein